MIDEAATRGAALSTRLLAFASGQPAQPRDVDVEALLVEASRLLRPARGGIEVVVVATAGLPAALVDAGQVMAAVLSLAIAARNAMPEGGVLTFATRMRSMQESAAPSADVGRAAEDAIVIALHAHGYGEVAKHPEQIFTEAGTVEEFVAPSSGHVVILAPSGAEACVEIVLPRAPAAASWLARR